MIALAARSMYWKREAGVSVDEVPLRSLKLLDVDVLVVDAGQGVAVNHLRGVVGRLAGPQIAAVAENRQEVTPGGVGARRRGEVAGERRPVLGMLEDIEEVALGHAAAQGPPHGLAGRRADAPVRLEDPRACERPEPDTGNAVGARRETARRRPRQGAPRLGRSGSPNGKVNEAAETASLGRRRTAAGTKISLVVTCIGRQRCGSQLFNSVSGKW
jgi:hypothetical protein